MVTKLKGFPSARNVITRNCIDQVMCRAAAGKEKRGAARRAVFSLPIRKVTCLLESSVLVSFHHRPISIQRSCDEVSRARARGARVTQYPFLHVTSYEGSGKAEFSTLYPNRGK